MSWIHDALAEFGHRLGIQHLDFGRYGVAQLAFEDGGLVALEPVRRGTQDEVLVYLARPVAHQAPLLVRGALAKAHLSHGGPMPVQVALRGNGPDALLLAGVRLHERAFTAQTLAQAVEFLGRWLDEVQSGKST